MRQRPFKVGALGFGEALPDLPTGFDINISVPDIVASSPDYIANLINTNSLLKIDPSIISIMQQYDPNSLANILNTSQLLTTQSSTWSDFFSNLFNNLSKIGLTYLQYKMMMDAFKNSGGNTQARPDPYTASALMLSAMQPKQQQQDITKIVALGIGGLAIILVLVLLVSKK
jgi:hypothetical protein